MKIMQTGKQTRSCNMFTDPMDGIVLLIIYKNIIKNFQKQTVSSYEDNMTQRCSFLN